MKVCVSIVCLIFPVSVVAQSLAVPWSGYGHDAQHTGLATSASQSLNSIHWSTPVDENKPAGELFIHYGSPVVTAANTVLVPVKIANGSADGFKVTAFSGGSPLYTLTTDYSLPPHNWTPSYSPTLSLGRRLYYAGAGGTVFYRDQVDSATGPTGRIAFYGNALYTANTATFNSSVQITTPLTADRYGNIFFGFTVTGPTPGVALESGIARIAFTGAGSWSSGTTASGGAVPGGQLPLNCAPALSNDHRTLYFAVAGGGGADLVSVNSTTLAPINHVLLVDPNTQTPATVSTDSSASPVVGPDGDVYYGVLETPCCTSHNDRGWLLHFDSSLATAKTIGSFGWDTTPSIVPRNLVPGYAGASSYLILTKYNNYVDRGGDGINKVAMLDPNATMPDPVINTVSVMKEIKTVLAVTADGPPPAVKEWCINSAAIDPFTKSAIVNNEDGTVYRWDLVSGTLTQSVSLNAPIGEAYTPTLIGPDGTVYVINDGILYAIGN